MLTILFCFVNIVRITTRT
uniref:Uncharacterized protein n=1 Tax=Arundo donax TaxID=35708 RepID=A0A0A8ZA40_ARUDO